MAGAGFQGLTRNPLAEPSVLGVSSGAAFGVVLGAGVRASAAGCVEALGLAAFAFAGALRGGQRRVRYRGQRAAACRCTRCCWPG